MRVIAGSRRSLQLTAPQGMDTRPTTDRIKETLFNMIQNEIPGCVFVDMFAGSGAIGIEALSRGAKKAYFVENARNAIACIETNLRHTRFEEEAVVCKQSCIDAVRLSIKEQPDIIFMDPPYDKGLETEVLKALAENGCIGENTLIIIEASLDTDFMQPELYSLKLVKDKQYKTNRHFFLRPVGGV